MEKPEAALAEPDEVVKAATPPWIVKQGEVHTILDRANRVTNYPGVTSHSELGAVVSIMREAIVCLLTPIRVEQPDDAPKGESLDMLNVQRAEARKAAAAALEPELEPENEPELDLSAGKPVSLDPPVKV